MKEYISSDKEFMELTNSENKKYHLLIADKDKISIDNTIKVFKSEIYKFTEITKSKDLIATIKKEKPDLVILEVNLNEVDGIDVCTDLRSDVTFAKLPIIFVSNNADDFTQIAAFDAGDHRQIVRWLCRSSARRPRTPDKEESRSR